MKAQEPVSVIRYVNEIAETSIEFDQDIYLKELLENLRLQNEIETNSHENPKLRFLESISDQELLSMLIKTEIVRGSAEDSADQEMLTHKVTYQSYTRRSIELKLNFDNPLYVSMGSRNDILLITFLQPEMLIGMKTGQPLAEKSFTIQKSIPKQFPDQASYNMAVVAGSTA